MVDNHKCNGEYADLSQVRRNEPIVWISFNTLFTVTDGIIVRTPHMTNGVFRSYWTIDQLVKCICKLNGDTVCYIMLLEYFWAEHVLCLSGQVRQSQWGFEKWNRLVSFEADDTW